MNTPTSQQAMPLSIIFEDNLELEEFIKWTKESQNQFKENLLNSGALLIKGLDVDSAQKFQYLMQILFPKTKSFLDGNSSRGKYTETVYNASEYDSESIIQLHTEFSYSNIWPTVICFSCAIKPEIGGQTTVGDCRKVLELLDPKLVEEFKEKGITYIRNLHGGMGLGPSWKEAFETESKEAVEIYCKQNNISIKWNNDNSLKVIQTRPAVRRHPETNEELWFNQVDQFYPEIYGEEIFDALLTMHNGDRESMPMYATYGDGSLIQKEYVEAIIKVLNHVTVPIAWEKGDLLIVDNMLALHGRLPFKGDRKILVSMA